MIGQLTGTLVAVAPERVVVDVGGVGYRVAISLTTFYELERAGAAGRVRLFVHTHVREDQIALYGFATRLELDLFERLIGVGGIGPKIALAALSGIEPHELVRAVGSNDTRRLSSIPGIGKKTAERISLELRDKLPALPGVAAGPVAAGPAADADRRADLVSALVNLGYPRPSAERAIDGALETEADTVPFEHLLRRALRSLARSSTR